MRRDPEKNGHDHGASAGNCREARHGTLDGGMPWSDNPWRDPALVTCEQVGNAGYPATRLTEIREPAGVLLGRRYPEERIPAYGY